MVSEPIKIVIYVMGAISVTIWVLGIIVNIYNDITGRNKQSTDENRELKHNSLTSSYFEDEWMGSYNDGFFDDFD
jgi:hypothetical protein